MNCILAGVGGQGTVLASKLIAQAGRTAGRQVRTAETIGMAQRGGCVVSHVRTGDVVLSPLVPLGQADVLIGFEPAEAVRCLPYLKAEGTAIVCTKAVRPVTASLTGSAYDGSEMIEYLQKNKMKKELQLAAVSYRQQRVHEKEEKERILLSADHREPLPANRGDNHAKTFGEFIEKWLPYHVRKKCLSPNTYDSYRSNLDNHILPVFGDIIMSTITAEDIDDFLDSLTMKPCGGSKAYRGNDYVETLSSATVKKCYTVLTAGFSDAKKWHYIDEIPEISPPVEKGKKRRAWEPQRVFEVMEAAKDNKLLHRAIHLAFVCSLRAGEVAGIDLNMLDFRDNCMWIVGQIQRVSDKALAVLPNHVVLRVFPKFVKTSKSSLILKGPKTEGSRRKQYLTAPLAFEIHERMDQIKKDKAYFDDLYSDYGLLLCQADGRPIDQKALGKAFKELQRSLRIPKEEQIEFQGLRKSGQMHKVRLTQNNYQLVAENSGQSPEVLMSNYNEAREIEKRALAAMVERSFYPEIAVSTPQAASIMEVLNQNPDLAGQILKNLLLQTAYAQPNTTVTG